MSGTLLNGESLHSSFGALMLPFKIVNIKKLGLMSIGTLTGKLRFLTTRVSK